MKTCPNCGAPLKDGVDVCDQCGALSEDLQDLLAELASDNAPKEELEINVPDENLKESVNEDSVINNLHKELGFDAVNLNNSGEVQDQNAESVETMDIQEVVSKVEHEDTSATEVAPISESDAKSDNAYVEPSSLSEDKAVKPATTLEIEDIEIPCDNITTEEWEYKSPVKKLIGIIVLIIIFAAAGVGGYKYYQYQSAQKEEAAAQKKAAAAEKEKAEEEAEIKKAEEEAAKKAEEAAKKAAEEKDTTDDTSSTSNSSTTTTNNTIATSALGAGLTGVDSASEPARLYNDSYPNGDVKLYWICDRTLSDDLIKKEAEKWGASWIIQYVYAKHGYTISRFNYEKYGFSATTTDKTAVEAQFNGAEKRNITKLLNY